jgi:hypothetical protein
LSCQSPLLPLPPSFYYCEVCNFPGVHGKNTRIKYQIPPRFPPLSRGCSPRAGRWYVHYDALFSIKCIIQLSKSFCLGLLCSGQRTILRARVILYQFQNIFYILILELTKRKKNLNNFWTYLEQYMARKLLGELVKLVDLNVSTCWAKNWLF